MCAIAQATLVLSYARRAISGFFQKVIANPTKTICFIKIRIESTSNSILLKSKEGTWQKENRYRQGEALYKESFAVVFKYLAKWRGP